MNVNKEAMKRFIVHFEHRTFGEWVWAENKRAARKQMTPYARCIRDKITDVEYVGESYECNPY